MSIETILKNRSTPASFQLFPGCPKFLKPVKEIGRYLHGNRLCSVKLNMDSGIDCEPLTDCPLYFTELIKNNETD